MRKFKYALLAMLVLGAVTLADGIEVLKVTGIEVLCGGDSVVTVQVGDHPMAAVVRGVMVIDGIEVLAEEQPVLPGGGMHLIHFPVHQLGNRVDLCDPVGVVLASDYADGLQND